MRVRKRWPASIEQRCRTSPWTILLFLSLEKHQIQGFCPVQLAFEVKNKYEKLRQWCSAIINHEWRRTMRNGRSRKSLQMQKTNLYRFTNTHMYLCTYVSCYMPKLQICFFFFIYMRFLHWIWYSLHFLLILFFLYCSLKFYQYQYFMVLYQFLNMWIFIFFIYFVIIFSI